MAFAVVVAALAASPVPATADGIEILEAVGALPSQEPIEVLLRVRRDASVATPFAEKQAGQLIVVCGDLRLDASGDRPVILARSLCNAAPDQFLNEVSLVGRIAGDAKQTSSGKSASRSLAINRYVQKEETTDWYRLRGYGYTMQRLIDAPKGALVEVTGAFEQRTSQSGGTYIEIKARTIRVHGKSKRNAEQQGQAPASSSAAGYSHADFMGEPNDDMPSDWS